MIPSLKVSGFTLCRRNPPLANAWRVRDDMLFIGPRKLYERRLQQARVDRSLRTLGILYESRARWENSFQLPRAERKREAARLWCIAVTYGEAPLRMKAVQKATPPVEHRDQGRWRLTRPGQS